MKLTGELGKKLIKRALIIGGTVFGISLVATLAKDNPEPEELTDEPAIEETESEEDSTETEEG